MDEYYKRTQHHSGFPTVAHYSPYLNIDRSIFKNREPQYIMPEGAAQHRGRFEMAFSQIGGCVIMGALGGGVQGLYHTLKDAPTISAGEGQKPLRLFQV